MHVWVRRIRVAVGVAWVARGTPVSITRVRLRACSQKSCPWRDDPRTTIRGAEEYRVTITQTGQRTTQPVTEDASPPAEPAHLWPDERKRWRYTNNLGDWAEALSEHEMFARLSAARAQADTLADGLLWALDCIAEDGKGKGGPLHKTTLTVMEDFIKSRAALQEPRKESL